MTKKNHGPTSKNTLRIHMIVYTPKMGLRQLGNWWNVTYAEYLCHWGEGGRKFLWNVFWHPLHTQILPLMKQTRNVPSYWWLFNCNRVHFNELVSVNSTLVSTALHGRSQHGLHRKFWHNWKRLHHHRLCVCHWICSCKLFLLCWSIMTRSRLCFWNTASTRERYTEDFGSRLQLLLTRFPLFASPGKQQFWCTGCILIFLYKVKNSLTEPLTCATAIVCEQIPIDLKVFQSLGSCQMSALSFCR